MARGSISVILGELCFIQIPQLPPPKLTFGNNCARLPVRPNAYLYGGVGVDSAWKAAPISLPFHIAYR